MPSAIPYQTDQAWPSDTMNDDFTVMWQRHIEATRHEFSRSAKQTTPRHSESHDRQGDNDTLEVGEIWDETMDSVVDALQELAVQSPITADTYSPQAPWFPNHEAYSETAPSSPHSSHWSHAVGPHQKPTILISDHDDDLLAAEAETDNGPPTPMIEIGRRGGKGKGLASYYFEQTRRKSLPAGPTTITPSTTPPPPIPARSRQRDIHQPAYTIKNRSHHIPTAPATAIPPYRAAHQQALELHNNVPPSQVHVLILTWAKHDRRGDDGQLLSPGLDQETDTVRSCFKRRGYRVQCRLIPEDYPTSAVETMLDRFLANSAPGSLLVVYYHGYGNMEGDRMVFSSGFGGSYFYWDDVRDPVMQAPGEVLLVFDCSAAPGAEQPEILVEPGLTASPSIKQLLGVCSPYSSGTRFGVADDFMTKSLCRILDEGHDKGDTELMSVQGLCSQMKEDLRDEDLDGSSVFVTQLGGGELLDIYLPDFTVRREEEYSLSD